MVFSASMVSLCRVRSDPFLHLPVNRDHEQEVAELRQKLQEVQIGTALSQADSNFLQRELDDREADIGGWPQKHV